MTSEELQKIVNEREELIRKLVEMVRIDEEALGIRKSCLRLLAPEDYEIVKKYL